jgi:hypothetical protein
MPVAAHQGAGSDGPGKPLVQSEYDPFSKNNIYGNVVDPDQEDRRVA